MAEAQNWPGRRHYGIAEIADALGIDRQLVTVWRRRSSHGMPAPDDELASGPLWLAHTIEPWIGLTRARLDAEAASRGAESLTPRLARQVARRFFRLMAVLLEEQVRAGILKRSLEDLGKLADPVAAAVRSAEGSKRGLADLVSLTQMAGAAADRLDAENSAAGAADDQLLAVCLEVLPQVNRILARAVDRE